MGDAQTTCWTMIQGAAAGREADRAAFARQYAPVIRAYLAARWRGTRRIEHLDDAMQEVFVECYRQDGVLAKAAPDRPGGFRAFLYGVLRNVALRAESRAASRRERQARHELDDGRIESEDDRLSRVFDRAWAQSIMRQAAGRQAEWAAAEGAAAQRRVELLRLRFQEGLPIREIARRFDEDAVHVHREYAKARKEFRKALLDVMMFHVPSSVPDAERECARLLALLA